MTGLAALFGLHVLLAAGGASTVPAPLDSAVTVFLDGRVEEALPLFDALAGADSTDAKAMAWSAECLRRLGRPAEAERRALNAVHVDPRCGMAHEVLAELYTPRFRSGLEAAGYDPAWDQVLAAVESDPDDGPAWRLIWIEALRRGDLYRERTALRRLHETGHFTPALLAYNRWVLENLPPRAVLFTNGDLDTYPAVMLQEVEGFRKDVAVVNLSLLNIDWYARAVAERNDLPAPERNYQPYRDTAGRPHLSGDQVVEQWAQAVRSGELDRPLAVAMTVVSPESAPGMEHFLELAGPCFLFRPDGVDASVNVQLTSRSLEGLDPGEFTGSWWSEGDRTPGIRTSAPGLGDNIPAAALRLAVQLTVNGDREEALGWVRWAEEFKRRVPGKTSFDDAIRTIRERNR